MAIEQPQVVDEWKDDDRSTKLPFSNETVKGEKEDTSVVCPSSGLIPLSVTSLEIVEERTLKDMCYYCFDVLLETLGQKKRKNNRNTLVSYQFENIQHQEFPIFITWRQISSSVMVELVEKQSHESNEELRGCIGTFEPFPLKDGLKEYTLMSAFKDRRFTPITIADLKSGLTCSVSLLTNFEVAKTWNDWTIGVHGITIEFIGPKDFVGKSATFLPEVAKENGWDHRETLQHLVRKAGYHTATNPLSTEFLRNNIRVKRYQSLKHSATYDEYISHRKYPNSNASK
jgi:AMME syndrome candidate gene 1 protein